MDFGTPEELYQSNRVKSFFKYTKGKERAILSYKYGLVGEDEKIDNYEQTDYDKRAVENLKKKAKGKKLIVWLPRPVESVKFEKMLKEAGIDYEARRTIKPQTTKKAVDRSKSIAAGKNLYIEKYDPKKTHLALTKTMTNMQKRRLIKTCIDNGIDTKELDPSLKYDENQELIDHKIELNEDKIRDTGAKIDKKISHLEGNYYGSFSKKRIKERALDEKTTEPTVITEEDLIKKRKKKQLAEWEDEPYLSKIDVEDIDTKKVQETQQEKREREFRERLAKGEVKLATRSPKEQLQDIGSNLPKTYDGRYRGTMVEFDKTIDYIQKNKNEIIGLTDLTSKDFDGLRKGSRADQMQNYQNIRNTIWSAYYKKD